MTNKVTLATLKKFKQQDRPITVLSCYDYSTAVLLEEAGVDSLIVGDSLAQVMLGHQTTLSATMEIMLALTAAVRKGAPNVYLVGDMPFLSYQVSHEQAIINAGRFLTEAGCEAVKVEVDHRHIEIVNRLTTAGIPVMAHLGYRPQSAYQSEKVVQTREVRQACQLVRDALDMVQAGASSILLECVTTLTAQAVTQRTELPVISCGSGPYCDGQVLVLHEVMSLPGASNPRFSKSYAQIGDQIRSAAAQYVDEIQKKIFPDDLHSYHMAQEYQQQFKQWLQKFDQADKS